MRKAPRTGIYGALSKPIQNLPLSVHFSLDPKQTERFCRNCQKARVRCGRQGSRPAGCTIDRQSGRGHFQAL